jgi:DNA-binding XRE family transcriptional regulator
MLAEDRKRVGWTEGQVARLLCVSVRTCRAIEAGERSPSFETWTGSASYSAGYGRVA